MSGLDERTVLIGEVSAALAAAATVRDAMRALVACLTPAFCDGCEVVLPDDDGTLRRVAAGPGAVSAWERVPVPEVANHPVRQVMASNRPLVLDVDNPEHVELFGPLEDPLSARSLGLRCAVLAPVLGRTKNRGVLAVAMVDSGRTFGADDVELVETIARLAGLAVDNLDALDRQRRETAELRRAGRVAVSLNAADDLAQIGLAIVDVAKSELGAASGVLYVAAGEELHLVATSGYGDEQLDGWRTISLDARAAVADACRTGQAVVCESPEEIVAHYPGAANLPTFEEQALVTVPLAVGGRVLGAAYWSFDRPKHLSQEDLEFIELVAQLGVSAIVRVRARQSDADYAARMTSHGQEQSASRARIDALAGANVIGTIAGRDDRITEANRMFLDMLGLPDGAVVRGDLSYVELTPPEWHPLDAAKVAEMRVTGRLEPYEKEYLRTDGSRVPVMIGGATLSTDPFQWIVFVVDLSAEREAEAAVERANERLRELLTEQRRISDVLQRSLLPGTLPVIPGLQVHADYWSERSGLRVGGDFYDVFEIADGRWGVLIGDVCGKGVEAAAVTATARHTARAAAMHLREPHAVLQWVHEAVAASPLDTYCTVAFALVEADGHGFRLDVCLGGHPPGLLSRPDGSIESLGQPGTLLGMLPPSVTTTTHRLEPGDLALFYTDGVTDSPGVEAMAADDLSTWLCDQQDRPTEQIGQALRDELTRRRPGGFRDDIATVVLRVDDESR